MNDTDSGATERLRQAWERQREREQAAKGNGKGDPDERILKTGRGARFKLTTDDFWCHMPSHKYIYTENGDLWPSSASRGDDMASRLAAPDLRQADDRRRLNR
ncbi:hypothetical protein M728_001109 [Ensifer sp. WSM1721]|uniref:hypothetical protein n=1 Tax=Ensifer sp. WSM1721 TaxID=1041159 RepID=UPI0012ECB022|nr:hypothetical protein [Ensifer sp. WSM1721]